MKLKNDKNLKMSAINYRMIKMKLKYLYGHLITTILKYKENTM